MRNEDFSSANDGAEELLRRALLDESSSVAVSLTVGGLPLSDAVTVIFHGRRDLGTLQTYVACGRRGAGATVSARELLRVPCDLDLADAEDRAEAEHLYLEQASALRDALIGADIVLDVWRDSVAGVVGSVVNVDHSVQLSVRLPAPRLLPTALVAPESQLVITPVCSARTLSAGKPPMGIACAQQDVTRVYPLADDPERCVEDFLVLAAEHARVLAQRLDHQASSVERFLELSRRGLPAGGLRRRGVAARRAVSLAPCAAPFCWRWWPPASSSSCSSAVCWPVRSRSTAPSARPSPRWCRPRRAGTPAGSSHASPAVLPASPAALERPPTPRRCATPGVVSIIQIQTSAGFSLTGTARHRPRGLERRRLVADRPVRRVHRAGNVVSGLHVELLALSRRIASDADCPARFEPGRDPLSRRGSACAPVRAPERGRAGARGAGRRSASRPWSRRRTRAGSASGSGRPPPEGDGRDRGHLRAAARRRHRSRSPRAACSSRRAGPGASGRRRRRTRRCGLQR